MDIKSELYNKDLHQIGVVYNIHPVTCDTGDLKAVTFRGYEGAVPDGLMGVIEALANQNLDLCFQVYVFLSNPDSWSSPVYSQDSVWSEKPLRQFDTFLEFKEWARAMPVKVSE